MCGDAGLVGQTIRFTGLGVNQSAAVIKIDLIDGRSYRQLLNGDQNEFLVPERMAWGAVARITPRSASSTSSAVSITYFLCGHWF